MPKLLSILGPRPAGPSPRAAGARPRLARLRIPSNLTKALGFETYIKRLSLINRAGFASSATLFIISLLIIFPIYYKTNLAEAAGSLSDTTLSITSDNLTAGVELLVTSDSGTFASSTSPMTFNVTTNNVTGYMLSISAKSGTDLTNATAGTSFTSLDATNSTIAAGITADTFGNTDNTVYNNMWGFKPSYYKSTANSDKFYPSPTTSGVILNKTTCANNTASSDSPLCQATSNTYTIAIGARATYSQVAGTYSNTYILSGVGNYPIYKITYADTTGDGTVSNLPAEQKPSADSTAITVKLSSTIPTRTGYTFNGWCTVNTATCSNDNKYNPGDTYSLSTLNANTVTLYATWTINYYTQNTYARYQDTAGNYSGYSLINTASVAYGGSYSYYYPGEGARYYAASVAQYTVTNAHDNYIDINRQIHTIYFDANGGVNAPASQNFYYESGAAITTAVPTRDGYSFSYWYGQGHGDLAPGGNIPTTWGSNTLSAIWVDNIAPTHTNWWWGEVNTSVARLYVQAYDVSGVQTVQCPASTATGGYNNWQWFTASWDAGANAWRCDITPATFGHYGQTYAVHLYMYDTLNNGGYYNATSVEIPSNCSSTVSGTMQEFNPCSSLADGTSGSLTDSRDGQIYTVKKINGQWWMTRNLAIGCNGSGSSYGSSVSSKSITSASSNVSTNFSTPTALLSAASASTQVDDYSTGRIQCSSYYGAWYNYYATTAGTISGYHNAYDSTKDICPLNWHLPSGPNTTSGTDFNKLVGNTTISRQNATSGLIAFSAVASGFYRYGSLSSTETGHWWSATVNADDDISRYGLYYDGSDKQFIGRTSYWQHLGLSVRCVRDS